MPIRILTDTSFQTHRVLPTFNEGDLNIHFAHYGIDSPVIHVDKALMALYAPNLGRVFVGKESKIFKI